MHGFELFSIEISFESRPLGGTKSRGQTSGCDVSSVTRQQNECGGKAAGREVLHCWRAEQHQLHQNKLGRLCLTPHFPWERRFEENIDPVHTLVRDGGVREWSNIPSIRLATASFDLLQHVEQGWPNERNIVQRGGQTHATMLHQHVASVWPRLNAWVAFLDVVFGGKKTRLVSAVSFGSGTICMEIFLLTP